MPESSSQSVSALLLKWRGGDEKALHDLLPLVYDELRRLAHHYLQRQRPDHTLQSTALVHEAYLWLVKQREGKFQNRAHFFAICAQLMSLGDRLISWSIWNGKKHYADRMLACPETSCQELTELPRIDIEHFVHAPLIA